jgi:hypothetical protein
MPTDAPNWPDEFFLDGPVAGGEELLRRTVANVHRRSARAANVRLAMLVVAMVLAGAVLAMAGMTVGTWLGRMPPPLDRLVASDPATGTRLNVTITAVDGGSALVVVLTGPPAGTACWLMVVGTDGTVMLAGGWRIGRTPARHPVDLTAWLVPDQVARVEVFTGTGTELVAG